MAKPLNGDLDFPVPASYQADLARARTGIQDPTIVTLAKGERLFRIASSVDEQRSVPNNLLDMLSSPWWWRESEWSKIQGWLDELHGYNPGETFRPLGAVKYEWGRCDRMLTARVGHDVKAFCGPGSYQYEPVPGGPLIVYQAASDLLQLYIPGIVTTLNRENALGDREDRLTLSAQGMQVITRWSWEQIDSRDDLGIRSLPAGTLVSVPGTRWLH